jgi:hypothetical protein
MRFPPCLIAFGLAGWLTASTLAADDVEVLGRGPVHEAYAEPSEREPQPTPVVPKEPPKPIEELPPDQKPEGDNVQWVPGYWQFDDGKKDFVWVSGFWRNAPPDRAWVPGSWHPADGGWQWTGGFWAAATDNPDGKADVQYLPPPPAPLDTDGPTVPAPSETDVYVPGSWEWRDHYVWRPGYWSEYQPGRVWVAAHYRWTPAGCVFIDGYWDYPLVDRGVLFAPVSIAPAVYADPGFVYTPSYVVQESCLYGSLFCRRHFGCYYFGDYFSPAYASLGFTPWCGGLNLSVGFGVGRWYDPLFAYYRCGFRSDSFWGGGGIFDLYAGRYRGDYLRPPVNLVQQTTVINNITRNTNINNVNVTNLRMVSSLDHAARAGRHHFQSVSDPARHQFARHADATRQAAAGRAATERELAARPGGGARAGHPQRASLPVAQGPISRPGPAGASKGTPAGSPQGRLTPAAPRPAAIGPKTGPARGGAPARSPAGRLSPGPRPAGTGAALPKPAASGPKGAPARSPLTRPTPAAPNRAPAAGRNPIAPRPPGTHRAPAAARPSATPPRTSPAVPRTRPSLAPRVNPAPRATPRPSGPAHRPAVPRPSVSVPRARSVPSAPRGFTRPAAPRSFARPAVPRPSVSRPSAPHANARTGHAGRGHR